MVELVAIMSAGAVLGFMPAPKTAPASVVKAAASTSYTPIKSVGVEPLTDEERKSLEAILKIDLNAASALEIEGIPGVGPKMAEAIVAYRDEHGPFKSFADLDPISGMGEKALAKFAEHARLGDAVASSAPKKPAEASSSSAGININTASLEEIKTLVGPAMAQSILTYREEKGKFKTVDELDEVKGIGPATLEKLRPNVRVD